MHPIGRLITVGGLVAAGLVGSAGPASADIGDNVNPGQNDAYSHAAQFVAGAGGGSGSSARPCQLRTGPYAGEPAHLEWNSYLEDDGTYSVWLNCVLDGYDVPSDRSQDFPDFEFWQVDWHTYGVVPTDPEELVALIKEFSLEK